MKRPLIFALASLLLVSGAFADTVNLGSGYKCDGSTILKGTREVSFSKAKSTLAQTLVKLKQKLKAAPRNKKAAIQAQINALNNSKTQIKACSNGQLSGSQVDPVFSQLAAGTGSYSGVYNGRLDGFFPLSGEVTVSFTLVQTTFSAILGLGGNLGSALNAKPLTFSQDVGGIGFPAQFFLQNTFLGDVTLSITQSGQITITNSNSPTGSVNFNGQFAGQTINATLNGTYSGHSFEGNAKLTK